jgi:hypothetical protein
MSMLMSMHCVLKTIVWTLAELSEVHCSLQGLLPSEFQFNYECDGGAISKSIHTLDQVWSFNISKTFMRMEF